MALIQSFLRSYPEAILFFCIMAGVAIGRIRFAGFSLGNATAVLIVSVIVGATISGPLGLSYAPLLKTVGFALFVFAVGFHGGPQFFGSLGLATLVQVVFAVLVAAVGLVMALGLSHLLGFDRGTTIGLAAGALTQTAMIGTALASLAELDLPPDALQQAQAAASVAYAITYIFGTIGVIAFAGQFAAKLMRVDLKEEARKLEAELAAGSGAAKPESLTYRRFDTRAYRVEAGAGRRVADVEATLGWRAAIMSVRRGGEILAAAPDLALQRDDEVMLSARRHGLVSAATVVGPELEGRDLLEPADSVRQSIVMTNRSLAGLTMEEVGNRLAAELRGIYVVSITRAGQPMPIALGLRAMQGDIIELAGPRESLDRLIPHLGVLYKLSDRSDLAWLGLGLLGGTILGALSLTVGGLVLTLGGGGGILIAGLIAGWYTSRHPLVGVIPHQATRMIWDLGLALFVCVLGLTAGPSAVKALLANGVTVLIAGFVVTMVPMLVAMYVGRYVFRMNPVIVCGALAGSMTQDAAMLAASDTAESTTPVLGFTVPYAIANVLLTLLGPIIVSIT
jgi:putative transport protein